MKTKGVVYGRGGLSKKIMWPIITGEEEDAVNDIVIGWAPAKWHHKGFTFKEAFSREARSMTTEEILGKCRNNCYSLSNWKEEC